MKTQSFFLVFFVCYIVWGCTTSQPIQKRTSRTVANKPARPERPVVIKTPKTEIAPLQTEVETPKANKDTLAVKLNFDASTGTITNVVNEKGQTKLIIPGKINGVPVQKIGDEAFKNVHFTSIVLPNSVKYIGKGAFAYCTDLKDIVLSTSLKTIDKKAFAYCPSLLTMYLPEGLTMIEDELFADCYSLGSIHLPESLEIIGKEAFSNCTALKEINLPKALKQLGLGALRGCTELTVVELPQFISTIQPRTFEDCKKLYNVIFPVKVDSILYNAFLGCKNLTSITLPKSLYYMDTGIFDDCDALIKIVIEARNPPFLGSIWSNTNSQLKIHVPSESIALYKTANKWQRYADIITPI